MIAIVERLEWRVENVELQSTANCYNFSTNIKSGLWGFLKSSVLVHKICFIAIGPMTEYSQVKESCKRNIKIFNKGFLSQYMLLLTEIKFAILRLETLNLTVAFIFVICNYRIFSPLRVI